MLRTAGILLLVLLTAFSAAAHPTLQNPLWIVPSKESVRLYIDVSIRELIVIQGLPVSQDGTVEIPVAEEFAAKHAGYVRDHITVKADGEKLAGSLVNIASPEKVKDGPEGPDQSHFRYTFDYALTNPPAVLTFSQRMCVEFPSAPGVPWNFSYLYRYGAEPGEQPLKFGPLKTDEELSIHTGFIAGAPAAGSTVVELMPKSWAGLWVLFVGAIFLGGTQKRLWYQLAAVLWLAGFFVASRSAPPEWPFSLLCGAVTVLAAADNIHGHAAAEARPRRRVLLLAGCALFGAGLSCPVPATSPDSRSWPIFMALWAAAGSIAVLWLAHLARSRSRTAGRLFTQLASLAICGAAIVLMLRLLHAMP